MRDKWLPAALVAAIIGAMFFALHSDFEVIKSAQQKSAEQSDKNGPGAGNEARPAGKGFFDVTLIDLANLVLAASTVGLWIATRQLWRTSAAHADHTRETLDAYRRAERAWLGFWQVETTTMTNARSGKEFIKEGLVLTMHFINSGRTPSMHTESWSKHVVVDINDQVIPTFRRPNIVDGIERAADIPPNGTYGYTVGGLNDANTIKLNEGKSKVIMWAYVEYRDSFVPEEVRSTEVCIQMTRNGDFRDPTTGRLAPRYVFSIIGPQNRAT